MWTLFNRNHALRRILEIFTDEGGLQTYFDQSIIHNRNALHFLLNNHRFKLILIDLLQCPLLRKKEHTNHGNG